ncbi:MAG: M23 family metallopeptidase, partial [Firmicutes bacterium]|nr:M23 family metallopeptidase [Bacillota bacterium]
EEANRVQGTGVFTWPVPGYYKLSDSYGWRICPYHGKEFHAGIDISSSGIYGANIVAADAGTVLLSRAYGDYGNCIMIDHGNGYVTLYAHMKSLSQYGVGTKVSKGQTIGYVGSTGASTGPHLHFEVRKNGSTVDPMSFF